MKEKKEELDDELKFAQSVLFVRKSLEKFSEGACKFLEQKKHPYDERVFFNALELFLIEFLNGEVAKEEFANDYRALIEQHGFLRKTKNH